MTDLRTAAQQALEALEKPNAGLVPHNGEWMSIQSVAITALRAALAEPVQEPVAWIHTDPDNPRVKFLEWRDDEPGYRGRWIKTPLYTAPPQRKPLTGEEITQCFKEAGITIKGQHWTNAVRNVERAHGIGGEA